ncbi:hypothetical protein NW754_001498 [Fusarium falciforme]|nr:hypothetical protein NW754_001498 [Fusarium falciforme]
MTYVHGDPKTMTKADLDYLVHHIFLPTKLPGGDDSSAENEMLLVDFVLDSLACEYRKAPKDPYMQMAHRRSYEGSLQKLIAPVALFHVAAQNGGVLVHKKITSVIFETFELSPANKAVVTTQGRLVRQFPANATEIPCPDFEDETFQSVFTKTLEKTSHQTVREAKHKVRKAKQEHDEDRETEDPRIVTDLLPSMPSRRRRTSQRPRYLQEYS